MSPSDSLIGPLVAELITVAQQIEGIDPDLLYDKIPDAAPQTGSVLFLVKDWDIVDPTNGRLVFKFNFQIFHLFDRNYLADALDSIQQFLPAWASVLSAWGNQTLNGKADSVTLEGGSIKETVHAGQSYLALVLQVAVLTEFLIDTTGF